MGLKRGRVLAEDPLREPVEPLSLPQDYVADEKTNPLALAQRYLCEDFTDFRGGNRPLEMKVGVTARGVTLHGLSELRLADLRFLQHRATVVAAQYIDKDSGVAPSGSVAVAFAEDAMVVHVNVCE